MRTEHQRAEQPHHAPQTSDEERGVVHHPFRRVAVVAWVQRNLMHVRAPLRPNGVPPFM